MAGRAEGLWSAQDALQSLEGLGETGVFVRMMEGLVTANAEPTSAMIDATYLKAHRTASSLRVEEGILSG